VRHVEQIERVPDQPVAFADLMNEIRERPCGAHRCERFAQQVDVIDQQAPTAFKNGHREEERSTGHPRTNGLRHAGSLSPTMARQNLRRHLRRVSRACCGVTRRRGVEPRSDARKAGFAKPLTRPTFATSLHRAIVRRCRVMNTSIPDGFLPLEAAPGFNAHFGPIWVNRAARKLGFRVIEQHLNPRDVCHGGALSTFADYQIVAVIADGVPLHEAPPTISLSIDYLRAVPKAAWVEAEVTLLRETRTLVFTQAVLTVDGEPVARSSGIYRKSDRAPGGRP
jgi:acyl-coenzyme A thioesterase PaaI-like protein